MLTPIKIFYHENEAVAFWVSTTLQWLSERKTGNSITATVYFSFQRPMPRLKGEIDRQFTANFEKAMRDALEAWVKGECVCSLHYECF